MKRAVIAGGGVAGLTAAYELLEKSDITPTVIEKDDSVGGISRTVNYRGNRMDIGGHRFFSKSERVMEWWLNIFPVEETGEGTPPEGNSEQSSDRVMLVRYRKSEIMFGGRLFDYPVSLSVRTVLRLGILKSIKILFSYLRATVFPVKPETSLEDFYINRFGRELYELFFKSYTEKVWGVPCSEINPDWGAQRVKGLSISRAIGHAIKNSLNKLLNRKKDIYQKKTETSLIEQFLYPKYGPGQLWDTVRDLIEEKNGKVITSHEVNRILVDGNRIEAVEVVDRKTLETSRIEADYFFSSMPVRELIEAMDCDVPEDVKEVSEGLQYRDFLSVGVLLDRLRLPGQSDSGEKIRDNWIYIQEPGVNVARIQFFNNWSPYLVKDPEKLWIGLEYLCSEDDEIWQMDSSGLIDLARKELVELGMIDAEDFIDATVVRAPKAYPAYFGTYENFDIVRNFLDRFENLFPIGRNGMHRYNNQDHSMLTAMIAVDGIISGNTSKSDIWAVNTELEYHEQRQ
ncbi:MAG: NAD(P)/FAD-dependent oxidoreductase [Actinobacteria bacterium]|nr:NAD(P)/FAD-dependent oxidoreductase [Actinomycetota bacterium]